ncbi:MAG: hypothetical protein KatS3mg110_3732 [Pirellulaceae bacterium]|nr:MAG: hypothetical protein KatS3mg110_3732 [Pirellulaceae bacterium]
MRAVSKSSLPLTIQAAFSLAIALFASVALCLAVYLRCRALLAACPHEAAFIGPCELQQVPCENVYEQEICETHQGKVVHRDFFLVIPTEGKFTVPIGPAAKCYTLYHCIWDDDTKQCRQGGKIQTTDQFTLVTFDCSD